MTSATRYTWWQSSAVGARTSGIETQTRYAIIYEVRDHAITRMTLYREPAEALEAAGLRE